MRSFCSVLICALALVQAPAWAEAKVRAAYLCQALISQGKVKGGPQVGDALYSSRLRRMLQKSVAALTFERRKLLAGTIHRLHVDLKKLKNGHFAVKQELIGAEQIRSYLNRVEKAAERLEREHLAVAPATQPYRTAPVLARDVTQLVLTGAIVGGLAYATGELFHADHRIYGAAGALLTFGVIYKTLVPYLNSVVADIRNVLTLKAHARGNAVAGPRTADVQDEDFVTFTDEVRTALKAEATTRAAVLMSRSRVALPLSRSTTAFWMGQREAPTAVQINEAMRRSGDFRLPFDARVLDTDHLFFFDGVLKQPVLVTFVRERGAY